MRVSELRVQLDRSLEGIDRFVDQVGERKERPLEVVRSPETRVRGGVVRIVLQRAFEERDGAVERLAAGHAEVHQAAGVRLVGLHRRRFVPADALDLADAEGQVQVLAQLVDDAILEVEDLADLPVHLDRADERARPDVHELRRDAHHVAEPLVAAGDDPRRAEAAADVDREPVVERGRDRRSTGFSAPRRPARGRSPRAPGSSSDRTSRSRRCRCRSSRPTPRG